MADIIRELNAELDRLMEERKTANGSDLWRIDCEIENIVAEMEG